MQICFLKRRAAKNWEDPKPFTIWNCLAGRLAHAGFLAWAVGHVEVLEAVPLKLSMEEVFVQSVESVTP